MDNLTHSLFGAVLARGLAPRTPHATLTLVLASNAPDLDAVAAFTGGAVGYLSAHRGPTHGPLGFLSLALLTAALVYGWTAWQARRRRDPLQAPVRVFGATCGWALLGVTLHALMDLPTSYGTRILSPFVQTWYALDWMPIIDVYLWGILIGTLAWCRMHRPRARRIAAAGLVLMLGYYGGRALLQQRALTDGAERTAAGHESPCAESPTLARHPRLIEASLAGPGACIQAAALPTFLSPLSWRVVRQYPHGYEVSRRNALRSDPDLPAAWIPSEASAWIARARATATGRVFLDFARFPAGRVVRHEDGGVVVRFDDVRFTGSPLGTNLDAPARSPFAATIALNASGEVVQERLGD